MKVQRLVKNPGKEETLTCVSADLSFSLSVCLTAQTKVAGLGLKLQFSAALHCLLQESLSSEHFTQQICFQLFSHTLFESSPISCESSSSSRNHYPPSISSQSLCALFCFSSTLAVFSHNFSCFSSPLPAVVVVHHYSRVVLLL